jgi:uncharacterized protein YcbX
MTATVATLWRYPVKSMLGEPCDEVELNTRGVRGDRQFAVRSADGKFGSGKNSRRFRHIEGLFSFRAQVAGDCPEITFPDGRRLRADDPAIDSTLSAVLGMPVTLARERDISHFDASPIHLVSTASLQWLQSRLPQSRVDERRFRPNITVNSDERELSWLGKTVCIGGVELRVTAPTGRCVMTTSAQTDLPFDPKILRCIAQEAGEEFGVYAEVLQAGRISRGDPVTLR